MSQGLRDFDSPRPAEPPTDASNETTGVVTRNDGGDDGNDGNGSDGTHTGVLIDAFATKAQAPSNGGDPIDGTDDDPSLNRAARRAQQRQDGQGKRPRR